MNNRNLHICNKGVRDEVIVQCRQRRLRPKSLGCPDGRDDFFRQCASIGDALQGKSTTRMAKIAVNALSRRKSVTNTTDCLYAVSYLPIIAPVN